MSVHVRPELIGKKLHRLHISINGIDIGEYERSQVADIDRKTEEIIAAKDHLLALFQSYGELHVRWDGKNRKKLVFDANKQPVGTIPKEFWRKPSWER